MFLQHSMERWLAATGCVLIVLILWVACICFAIYELVHFLITRGN